MIYICIIIYSYISNMHYIICYRPTTSECQPRPSSLTSSSPGLVQLQNALDALVHDSLEVLSWQTS